MNDTAVELAGEIARYLPIVMSEARRLSAGDLFTREDLVQEGVIAALSAFESHDPTRGSMAAYVRACARNRMISYLRRNRQEAPMEEEALNAQFFDSGMSSGESLQQDRIEAGEALARLIKGLSGFELAVLDAYLKSGGVSDAAALLNCDRKRVDNALQRIRNKARAL